MPPEPTGSTRSADRPFVLPLSSDRATELSLMGGKGANLARLVSAGFPVPDGFCVTTHAYRALVDDAALRANIEALAVVDPDATDELADRSAAVREAVRERELPEPVCEAVRGALDGLEADSVAVRSSATAEDLPTASFAGMHETFLGVGGEAAVLEALRDCLASLFTDRAVAYRNRNDIPHGEVAMAVVVQPMVDADAAGVLFTADPVTGNRTVASVDANFGLGDTVVAGDVSPDNARVDRETGEVLEYEVGDKRRALQTVGGDVGGGGDSDAPDGDDNDSDEPDGDDSDEPDGDDSDEPDGDDSDEPDGDDNDNDGPDGGEFGGGVAVGDAGTRTVELSEDQRAARVLTDDQLRELVALGGEVEDLLGRPQDVEWAVVDGEFVLLQSRPITSLFPVPTPAPDDGRLHASFHFGHAQAMPEALPPLVVDWWRGLLDRTADRVRDPAAEGPWTREAGHRVYVDLTPLLRVGPLRRTVTRRIGAVHEPTAGALGTLLERYPEAFAGGGRLETLRRASGPLRRVARGVGPHLPAVLGRIARAFLVGQPDPGAVRVRVEGLGDDLASRVREPDARAERVRRALDGFDLPTVLGRLLPFVGPVLLSSLLAEKALRRLVPDADGEVEAVSKGFEAELVTTMNQRLGDVADVAREHPAVREAVREGASLGDIRAVDGGAAFEEALESFLDDFGHRATGEIDLSRPRWRDDPGTLVRTVRSNLVEAESGGHHDHLRRLEREAEAAADRLEARADRGLLGPVRRRVVRRLVRTYRGGIQLREYPKQGVAHLFAAVHDEVADAGAALADEGRLDRPSDVWFLRRDELLAALEDDGATGDDAPIDVDIEARRRAHERDAGLTPPSLITSEGEVPTGTGGDELAEGVLAGTPVSAGVVEGPARVVRDPAGESLEKGEILVAPSTDPGWTPLFLNAAGLVMEVGGRMTHGALVAREYGIPAVVSVADATGTIETGERVRLDGERGTVELLDRG